MRDEYPLELEEAEAYSSLRKKFPMLKAVHRPPQVGRDFWGVLQIDRARQRAGMTMTLLLAPMPQAFATCASRVPRLLVRSGRRTSASKRATHGFRDGGVVLRRGDLEVDDEDALLGQALR